jgi:squalene-hopene/tetraprenyl-beta-curcumene cyclase
MRIRDSVVGGTKAVESWPSDMKTMCLAAAAALVAIGVGVRFEPRAQEPRSAPVTWDARSAAAYLDARQAWWLTWPNAARDHETACVSCHTSLPYALARPALGAALGEAGIPEPERRLLDGVSRRVRLWKDVDPFYPDQKNGLPKTSESRGTEAILNALVLATRDAAQARTSDEGRAALENMWALQFRAGDLSGAWAWLNFHYEPWESNDAPFFGAALAAIAVGTAPSEGAPAPDLLARHKALRDYLRKGLQTQSLFNRAMLLWASGRWPGLLEPAERQSIAEALYAEQSADGGWSLSALGQWTRRDGSALDPASDGYATGLVALAIRQPDPPGAEPHVARALAWLVAHQDRATGQWPASSLNKKRDPASDVGKFMSDAATAFAVLALTGH